MQTEPHLVRTEATPRLFKKIANIRFEVVRVVKTVTLGNSVSFRRLIKELGPLTTPNRQLVHSLHPVSTTTPVAPMHPPVPTTPKEASLVPPLARGWFENLRLEPHQRLPPPRAPDNMLPRKQSRRTIRRVPPCVAKTRSARPVSCSDGRGAVGSRSKQMSSGYEANANSGTQSQAPR